MSKQKKRSTALARRPAAAPRPKNPDVGKSTTLQEAHTVGDGIALGALGLVELKLTAKEEEILNEPVPIEAIEMKPTRVPTPYLSHPGYTRWLNRAFGRTGWAMVPAAKPMKSGNSVVCPYVLHIHGKPVAFAMGEQEYHENNKEQTYGDALESTVASALRRCAKRLGIGLELWDRRWLQRFVKEHAVCVQVMVKNEVSKVWRLKADPPLWNERRGGRADSSDDQPDIDYKTGEVIEAGAPPRDFHHNQSTDPITDAQLQRLKMAIVRSGRIDLDVKQWIAKHYALKKLTQIRRCDYDVIIAKIESEDIMDGRA